MVRTPNECCLVDSIGFKGLSTIHIEVPYFVRRLYRPQGVIIPLEATIRVKVVLTIFIPFDYLNG
jgi:hypothetical protein